MLFIRRLSVGQLVSWSVGDKWLIVIVIFYFYFLNKEKKRMKKKICHLNNFVKPFEKR